MKNNVISDPVKVKPIVYKKKKPKSKLRTFIDNIKESKSQKKY